MVFGVLNVRSALYSFMLIALICINLLIFSTNLNFQKLCILQNNGYIEEVIDNKIYHVKDYGALYDNLHTISYTKVKIISEDFDRTVVKVICQESERRHFYIRSDVDIPGDIICEHCGATVEPELIKAFIASNVYFQDNTGAKGAFDVAKMLFGILCFTLFAFHIGYLLWGFFYFLFKNRVHKNVRLVHLVLTFYLIVLLIVTSSNLLLSYTGF